jgi:hypothetical protein
MRLDRFLDDIYLGNERLTRAEIYRAAVAADLPAEQLEVIDGLPEGEYAQDEAAEALHQVSP